MGISPGVTLASLTMGMRERERETGRVRELAQKSSATAYTVTSGIKVAEANGHAARQHLPPTVDD